MLARETTPSAIVKYLDQYVIGQEDAKKVLAVAVYSHYRKIATFANDKGSIAKSNVLLVGPSGTGKTLLCDTLSRMLKVPFVTADATSLAQTKYVNEEIEAVLQRLLDRADGNIENAQHGIIFIDEIDKLKATNTQSGAISGESVQHALLKIMEGSPVKLKDNQYLDTSNVLFICGGAFVGIEGIMAKTHGFGFIATSADDNQNILDRLNKRVKPTDLFEFGLIPEFTGRLPVIANLHELSRAMLVRIMSVPKNSIYRQYIEIFRGEGVDLRIGPKVFEQIAEIAIEYKTGARSLRGIFEELITPILYVVPDHPEIARVEIASLFEDPRLVGRK
ncbi:MAG: ATP-dependent Clp protease ATP-binding subunit ClpX [Candidatus Accumulibacter appositus]|uniref:ATP-dependent Clp protease ATP-binding subunit ClpX n=1 Tax=Candidatus Accumulibacter appositus TaxID=1454003 RepID=A0A011QMA9_9PROT|nr:ATP-dependent Clp protease ATP-binding subunit ClpX [Accumulibacter sp.]EXI79964.1 MAG: ATP-dependent Clp protease ATP-binding subunit ClpX [Candidatus Accumulibacter appositus]HRF04112.1 ATP-dependent Clp protease ATP-binding subunit ClpX [Accumulibacter sp.]